MKKYTLVNFTPLYKTRKNNNHISTSVNLSALTLTRLVLCPFLPFKSSNILTIQKPLYQNSTRFIHLHAHITDRPYCLLKPIQYTICKR